MPAEVGIWRLEEGTERLGFAPTPSEHRLEDVLAADVSGVVARLLHRAA